jgi:hypothetical protein
MLRLIYPISSTKKLNLYDKSAKQYCIVLFSILRTFLTLPPRNSFSTLLESVAGALGSRSKNINHLHTHTYIHTPFMPALIVTSLKFKLVQNNINNTKLLQIHRNILNFLFFFILLKTPDSSRYFTA